MNTTATRGNPQSAQNRTSASKTLATLALACLALGAVSAAHAQSADAAQRASASHELTRAEVEADIAIWHRAHLDQFWRGEPTPDVNSKEYREDEAEYLRMRNGAEYQQELQRIQNNG